MNATAPAAGLWRARLFAVALAAVGVLWATGCVPFERVPERGIAELLSDERHDWNTPLRLTRGPGAEFNGDFHDASGSLLYVSDAEGSADVFLQPDAVNALEPPVKLAPHAARDRWPRFDGKGRRVAFVSTRDDAGGDVWTVRLPRLWGRPRPERITGEATADDQPCWHPDGRRLVYASAPALGAPFDLWEVRFGDPPRRLTDYGAQMPDCSPDGRRVVFVSSHGSADADLFVLRLADGAVARLTSGVGLDLYPCWSRDGTAIFFARIAFDSNGDGRLDGSDASSIYSVRYSGRLFEGGGVPPARQLTSSATADSFPRPLPGGFLFTRIAAGGSADVFALGESGEVPGFQRVSEFLAFARRAEEGGADPHRRLLAWQNAGWAAQAAQAGGRTEFDLASWGEAAAAWLHMGRAMLDLGWEDAAGRAFEALVTEFPEAHRFEGLARIELLALERGCLERTRASGAAWEEHLAAAQRLRDRFLAYAEEAEGGGRPAEAVGLRETSALAQLEIGRTLVARKNDAAALEALHAVPERYADQREAAARSLLACAEVYELLDDPQAVRATYLKALNEYADMPRYATEAAARVAETIVRPDAGFEERLTGLRTVIEQHAGVPVLPALAQNAIGDLCYARKDYLAALEAYGRTIEEFPNEPTQVAAAYLAIGRIRTEQQDYARAVETFERMRALFGASGGRFYEEARRGYVRSTLQRAAREVRMGDVQLALNTYGGLVEFDPALAAAHRGVVQCYARLGRAGDAVLEYRPRVEQDPRDHLAHYALALAYSYYGPSDWVGDRGAARLRRRIDREALRLVGRAVLMHFDSPYYHQLRGFLLNRLALTTGESEHRIRALDAYLAALGLADPEEDPDNYAALLLNVGEGYTLVGQPSAAYDYYRRAVEAGFDFQGAQGEVALTQVSRSALSAGDYPFAVRMLERALGLQGSAGEDDRQAVSALRRQAQTLDLLGLAHDLDGDYEAAVGACRRYAEAVERLIELDAEQAPGYRRNLLRARRNLAVNLYMAVEAGRGATEDLAAAHRLLRAGVEDLGGVGVVEWAEGGRPALVTIDVEVALGEREGPARFDAGAEMRLLYTYLARIEAAAGEHARAAECLRAKLALYPGPDRGGPGAEVLAEQAVVWTQIAGHELARGDTAAAADAYGRAVELERRAGNLEGEAVAAVSLGRALLRMAAQDAPPAEALAEAVRTHRSLMQRIREQGLGYLAITEAALAANLMALAEAAGPLEEVAE